MKTPRWIASAVACLLLVSGAIACIEALDLNKMVERTDAAVHGTITDVHSVLFAPAANDRRIYTVITVEGTDLYSGEPRTIEAAFLGGTYQGESMLVTCMPATGDYRLGNEVLVFSAPVEGWGPDVDRCVYAAMGGIFRTVKSPRGTVFLGKGEGTAIEKNTRLGDLLPAIAKARRAQEVK